MCQPCIRRLNASYDFKKQCILSAQTWKAYLELLNESQKKSEAQVGSENNSTEKEGEKKQNAFIRVVPNQKFVKLYVGPQTGQNQTSFQNVFLNIIPTSALKTQESNTTATISPLVIQPNVKDNNRNVFLNINNTFQRFIPVTTAEKDGKEGKKEDVNVTKILTEAKTEELSVEIDPTDFGCMSEDSPQQPASSNDNNVEKDWEEVIQGTKIQTIDTVPSLVPINSDSPNFNKSPYVPIVPKPSSFSPNDEEKYDFFNGGHFLTPNESVSKVTELNLTCELCERMFENMKQLRSHFKQFHLGKFPYKCDFCYAEFANRNAYNFHLETHNCPEDTFLANESLTLKDFPTNDTSATQLILNTQNSDVEMQNIGNKSENDEPETHTCDVCSMVFQSANGLVRHKVRKHNQKTKKKYFIKGMKNARCDICNRDFSTQSYLQIHLKLHEKKGPNYRGKIFRNKYVHQQPQQNGNNITESHIDDVIDITKDEQENGDIIEIRDPLSVEEDDETELEDIPKALKLKINLRKMQSMEIDDDDDEEDDECNISKAAFSDISLECEQYLLEQQNETNTTQTDYDCNTCKRSFENKSDLKRFLNSLHSKSLQFKCHLCDSSFCEIINLTKHLETHYTSASCTICQKMFSDENEIAIHNNFHENRSNWQCSVCYFVNNEIKSLKEHITEHENKISYRCHFCNEEFVVSQDLSKHIDTHDGSHCCNDCDQNFGYQHEKDIHDFVVHNKDRYSCEICKKSYKTSHDLVRHKNLHKYHPHLLHNEVNA